MLPPEIKAEVQSSRLSRADWTGDNISLLRLGQRNNMLGMIDNFVIFRSNLLPKIGGNHVVMFGHRDAISFALQFTTFDGPMKSTRVSGNHYRARFIYGYRVVKPEALGYMIARSEA